MIAPEARGAWKELESRLRPYLSRRVASPSDIDDLLQEIFVRLHQGLSELRDGERFGGWVYRIAHNVVVDRARDAARHPAPGPLLADEARAPGAEEDRADELQASLGECVASFVGRLPSP